MADILDGGGFAAELARGLKAEALITNYSQLTHNCVRSTDQLGSLLPEKSTPTSRTV